MTFSVILEYSYIFPYIFTCFPHFLRQLQAQHLHCLKMLKKATIRKQKSTMIQFSGQFYLPLVSSQFFLNCVHGTSLLSVLFWVVCLYIHSKFSVMLQGFPIIRDRKGEMNKGTKHGKGYIDC